MMNKKVIALTMVIAMVFLSSCGKEVPVIENQNETVETNNIATEQEERESMEEETEELTNDGGLTKLDAVTDADETDLNLKEYKYSFEDRDVADAGGAVFYLADFEDDSNHIHLTDSIQVYAFNGKCIGHTKEGIDITTIGKYGEWYYLMLDRNYRFVKVADVEVAGTDLSEDDESLAVATKETTVAPAENNNAVEAPPVSEVANDSVSEIPAEVPAQTSDKYTPEEAIAVWSGILNDNGMIYDPSIKEFASWGTGFIYLQKGMPEEAAQQDLLGYAYGDGGGHSSTHYYYEVTGSDSEKVNLTRWSY